MTKKNCCICLTKSSPRWLKTDPVKDFLVACFLLNEPREGLLCCSCRSNVNRHIKYGTTYPEVVDSKGKSSLKPAKLIKKQSAKNLHIASLKNIAREFIAYILSFLDIVSIKNFSMVNKKFSMFCDDPNLWYYKCLCDFKHTREMKVLIENQNTHWKIIYQALMHQDNSRVKHINELEIMIQKVPDRNC